ncbi:unnamed protein product [Pseudo-nitzschia multistriata]|uniref:SMP-LTD domain-containing protein n=1 Tax=Pseudo-nitzschia multistriata TaxID=183589 RepID=A0A448Z7Q7_9STRA|nr:unnamed protein product [Pseudo-nitzschia multistriata]
MSILAGMMNPSLLVCWLGVILGAGHNVAHAFVGGRTTHTARAKTTAATIRKVQHSLNAAPKIKQSPEQKARRKELLKRDGPYFKVDKLSGNIEFGAATKLVTDLSQNKDANKESIEEWLSDNDGKGLALSIWDESLMEVLPDSVYRLQTMPLKFVTLELQPSVDLQMWTQRAGKNRAGRQLPPIFKLNSVGFETNLRLLPGMGIISSESLGIFIEVAGDLRPTEDGTGVKGTISFQTKGSLPPPLRLLPDSALKLAADTINDTIVQFAVASFEKGAIDKYNEFMQQRS